MDSPAATDAGRKQFAASCVQLIHDCGFDGIDVDWEYPQNAEQGEQLVALLQEIRRQMDAYAETLVYGDDYGREKIPRFLLSIAAPAGKKNYKNMPLRDVAGVLDFVNLMVSARRGHGVSFDVVEILTRQGIRLRWLLGQNFRPLRQPLPLPF